MKRFRCWWVVLAGVVGCGTDGLGADPDRAGEDKGSTGTGEGSGTTGCGAESLDAEGCSCDPAAAPRACFVGDPSKAGVGACTYGTQTCATANEGEFTASAWGPCVGSGTPAEGSCSGGDKGCTGEKCDGDGGGDSNECDNAGDGPCSDGAARPCQLASGAPGAQACSGSQWAQCVCADGALQTCTTSDGAAGMQRCEAGSFSNCLAEIYEVGQPCTLGDVHAVGGGEAGCPYANFETSALYCAPPKEDGGGGDPNAPPTWQCMPANSCEPQACQECMIQNCAEFLVSTCDAACDAATQLVFDWRGNCGPRRSDFYSQLSLSCAGVGSPAAQELEQCLMTYCLGNGGKGNGEDYYPCTPI